MQKRIAKLAANLYIGALFVLLPLIPLLASVIFLKWKYVLEYWHYMKKMKIHIGALREGPALHYFEDVIGRKRVIPEDIEGSCVQCGNCCMEKRCVFLEEASDLRFQCGIYHSPWRKFSNCGSFPLNAHDIQRYACPSYQTVAFYKKPVGTPP